MQLTGTILFIGFILLFILWASKRYDLYRYKTLAKENEILYEDIKGIIIFILIAISAGMAWG